MQTWANHVEWFLLWIEDLNILVSVLLQSQDTYKVNKNNKCIAFNDKVLFHLSQIISSVKWVFKRLNYILI